jgi:NADPH-dependent curcumin reductase CurA
MNLIDHVGRYHGLEGAGVVRRVGPKVKDFKPGNRVAAMEHNMLSTLLIANEIMCVKIPESLSFIDAATMFTVYATVQQSLITVGQLKKGESLLIHSASGGVGLAAIQIARMIGAEIYATVGPEEKAQYLVKNCNIPGTGSSTLVTTLSSKECTARPTARVSIRSSTSSLVNSSTRPGSVSRLLQAHRNRQA